MKSMLFGKDVLNLKPNSKPSKKPQPITSNEPGSLCTSWDRSSKEKYWKHGRKTMIFLFDIDGTLAKIDHRLKYIQQETPDWAAFYANASYDEPIWEVITVARCLNMEGQRVFMSTGRTESIRELTMAWLRKFRIPVEALYMRRDGDHREDFEVKSEILDNILKAYPQYIPYNIIAGAFEDRQQVVKMYRERGLRVFQVAEGKF